jgi:hypothetical protein
MNTLPDLISESEALRRINIPSTPRWREFLREKIPARSAGGSTVYPLFEVELLAAQIADFAKDTLPNSTRSKGRERQRQD